MGAVPAKAWRQEVLLASFEFSSSEVKIWHNEETHRWFFMVNGDPLVAVKPESLAFFGKTAHVLTERAVDDWMTLITPPGPTATRIILHSDGDGMIKRIFDASIDEREGAGA